MTHKISSGVFNHSSAFLLLKQCQGFHPFITLWFTDTFLNVTLLPNRFIFTLLKKKQLESSLLRICDSLNSYLNILIKHKILLNVDFKTGMLMPFDVRGTLKVCLKLCDLMWEMYWNIFPLKVSQVI